MHAVFYRSTNLGHRGSPTREQLEESLRIAGAKRMRSFHTNGTVLLETDEPESVVRTAAKPLFLCAGYDGVAVIRTISSLRSTLTVDYFRAQTDQRTYKETFTFFDGVQHPTWTLPHCSHREGNLWRCNHPYQGGPSSVSSEQQTASDWPLIRPGNFRVSRSLGVANRCRFDAN